MHVISKTFCIASVALLSACQSAYYSAMETVGQHKRDIMVSRIEDAKESQQDAQQQFSSAVEQLSDLIGYDGGDLKQQYQITLDNYQQSEDAANEVSDRIEAIEDVAEALFVEWQSEIDQYSSQTLQRQSRAKLTATQRNYQTLMKSMRQSEQAMQPVLAALKDNMLFLKHNLNARAIGQLQGEYTSLKRDVDVLITRMNESIKRSQQFIDDIEQQ
ncbi:DUF2959 domain-containing protein [Thalassotalea ponticola]|uniref:DUF2959 domain-containing protein n=1 Tax=Thalassotalea ponticola TaxID=1523392 RepID=UPI0025B4FEF0|nr:DUF2959 domain-containing protein [Thalassotalea ponticola]MDN3651545.1 DUF2959 domain-containing protein [Thalassotalea ponticola]